MSTSSSETDAVNSADLAGYDADEWGQYRSLSTMAVVALILGLSSIVAFVSPLMLIVPLAAAAAALLALKAILGSEGALSGAGLARLGLALAILFGVGSIARVQVRELILQQQVDRVARQWLSFAAEGRAENMLDLMTRSAVEKVSPSPETGQPTPSFFGGMLASALLRQDPLVLGLSELHRSGELRYRLGESRIYVASTPPQAFLSYTVESGGDSSRTCNLELKRFRASEREVIWLVDAWELQ